MIVNEYELELEVTVRTTGEREARTVTEFAYSVSEAAQQAFINLGASYDLEAITVRVLHVGPPRRLVEMATKQLDAAVNAEINRLMNVVEKVLVKEKK